MAASSRATTAAAVSPATIEQNTQLTDTHHTIHSVLPPRYGLDIETDTSVGGLDPSVAAIVAVAVSHADNDVVFEGDEEQILVDLDAHLAALPAGVIVTWNGAGFDLPFIDRRAELLGVRLGLVLEDDHRSRLRDPIPGLSSPQRGRWYTHDHLDGYRLYRADVGQTLGLSCGLKAMARLVGLPAVAVDVVRLHQLPPAEVAAYVASDARLARQLVDRRLPHALVGSDRVALRCHSAVPH